MTVPAITLLVVLGTARITSLALMHVLLITLFASLAAFVLAYSLFYNTNFKAAGTANPWKALSGKSLSAIWASNLTSIAGTSIPFLVMPHMVDSTDIGLFGVSHRLVALAATVLAAMGSIFGPAFARAYSQHQYSLLGIHLRDSQIYATIAFLPFAVMYFSFPEAILSVFGDGFVAGKAMLGLLTGGQLVNSLTGSVGFFLNMTERAHVALTVNTISTITGIALTIALGWGLGIIGICIAYTLTLALRNLALYVVARRSLKALMHSVVSE